MIKYWQLAKKFPPDWPNQFPEIDPIILQLLFNRNLTTQEAIDEFLWPDYSQDLPDPFLFHSMEKAVDRIFQAREKKEQVVVHGDYDADGVTATAVMISALKAIGFSDKNLQIYIPHRVTEGYGLNPKTIKLLKKQGVSLVITVDCGISNKEEIAAAALVGMDVIVTDHHHEPLERPKALAIINPSLKDSGYPFPFLSGCGVAFKVAQALIRRAKKAKPQARNWEAAEKWLLDLVALGTIGDIMPLLGENRTLVKYGLVVLQKSQRPGLQQLAATAGNELPTLDTFGVAWRLVPRLNAAGRLDHGNAAYNLLMTASSEEAKKLAQALDRTNTRRQKLTEEITAKVKELLGPVTAKQYLLFACGQDWPMGVLGLAAGRIMDEFHRPTIVASANAEGLVGSGRSIDQFNIIEAIQQSEDLLEKFGGHAAACGFKLKAGQDAAKLHKRLAALAKKQLQPEDLQPIISLDLELKLAEANWDLFTALEQFPPYGEEAEQPKFLSTKLKIISFSAVGQKADHLRLSVAAGGIKRQVIGFGLGHWVKELKPGDEIDLVYHLDVNEWNGNRELQLKAVDLRPTASI